MKILLIKPRWYYFGGAHRYEEMVRVPPINLGIIAALSQGHDVEIIDEDEEKIDYSKVVDLVGITVPSVTINHVREIARKFQKKGIPVIIGGVHPSINPADCGFADSVIVGEVELIWKDILNDVENKSLKKRYDGITVTNLDDVPFPRRDLFKKSFFHESIQVSRGCNLCCDFCYLQYVPWKKFRKRSVKSVIAELKSIKKRFIFFLDDNLFCDIKYAKELFKAMIPLRKIWWIQAPTTIAYDDELLDLMYKSGCYNVCLGFQTIDKDSIKAARIYQNHIDNYKKIVSNIHRHKIFVNGFFIFGFDNDKPDIFDKTLQVIKEIDIDDAFLYCLTPYPGTALFDRLNEEGRILTKDYSKYTWNNCVFQPKHMSSKQVERGIKELYPQVISHFRKRLLSKSLNNFDILLRSPTLAFILLLGSFRKVKVERLP
jgi:radical SAM superfamily enzyme YgiQ (UPF0313 family)